MNTALETRAATPHINTEESYRLVFFSASGSYVFLRRHEGGWSLPELQIPKFSRVFAEIGERVHKAWDVNCSLLSSTLTLSAEVTTFYAAFEAPRDCEQLQGLTKCRASEALGLLDDRKDVVFLRSCIAQLLNTETASVPRPFTQLGWIYVVQDWVGQVPGVADLISFAQLSGSEDTCLIRFQTSQKTLWYKAVGNSDPKEFSITCALSKWLPQYLPKILAVDPRFKAWLMEAGGETALGDDLRFEAWISSARQLAAMQLDSMRHVSKVLETRAADLRIRMLQSLVVPFFEVMLSLMQQQVKRSPAPLSHAELNNVADTLRDALNKLGEIGIPDVIGHGDLNPGNILMAEDHAVFIDWSSAHVGSPLITLEYLIAHFRKNRVVGSEQEGILRNEYEKQWQLTIPLGDLRRAQEISPLVAVFASAISDNAWRNPARLARPGVPGYLRSLARIMNREVKLLTERRVLA